MSFLSRLRSPLNAALAALIGVGLLTRSSDIAQGILQGLRISGEVLIPALFPFMALCAYLVMTDGARILSIPLRPLTKYLFRLPGEVGAVVLASLIGGYPVGAKMVSTLLERERIDQKTARRMMALCYGSSPSFVITAVGAGMLLDKRAGVALFAAQIIASLVVGLLFSLRTPIPRAGRKTPKMKGGGSAFVSAVTAASSAMLTMCAFAVLFSGLLYMVQGSGLHLLLARPLGIDPVLAAALIAGLFEVTSGSAQAAALGGERAILLVSLFTSWGGLSVIFQVAAIFGGNGMPWKSFLLGRATHMTVAAAISVTLYRLFFFEEIAVLAQPIVQPIVAVGGSRSWLTALCLLAMCAMLTTGTGHKTRSRTGGKKAERQKF